MFRCGSKNEQRLRTPVRALCIANPPTAFSTALAAAIAAISTIVPAAASTHQTAQPTPGATTHSSAADLTPSSPAPSTEPAAPLDQPAATQPATNQQAQPSAQQKATDPFPPTGVEEELSAIRPGAAMKRELDRIAAETNIRFGFANTILFQQASFGPGMRTAAAGDVDVLARWTAIGAGTKDTGILAFAGEYRYQIGELTPSALGSEIGTLLPTTNAFNERPPVVKELYWDQRLFDDTLRFGLGRIDAENLFGGHRLQSQNTFFLYKAFSSNPTVAYPGQGLGAAAQIKPLPWLYVTSGMTDANGKATVGNFEGFFKDHEYLTFAEVGFTPTIDGLGTGRYRLAIWHIDSREAAAKPSDQGITVSLDQDIGESVTVFTRYGHADGDVTGIVNSVQGGIGIKDVLGKENMLGLAAAWSEPSARNKRDEKTVEIFQRFQITEVTQFTVGIEAIFDPSNAPGDDLLGVFSARLRISF